MTPWVPWLVWLLLVWRLVVPLSWKRRWKFLSAAGILAAVMFYHGLRFAANLCPDGDRVVCRLLTRLPRGCWMLAQYLYCIAGFLCVLLVLDWGVRRLMAWYGRCRRKPGEAAGSDGDRKRLSSPVILLVPAAVLSGLGMGYSLQSPVVREYTVALDAYPAEVPELRIAAVSDLHVDPVYGRDYVREIVRTIHAQAPDVILLLGDFSNTNGGLDAPVLAALRSLRAPEGVYAVTGNHEYSRDGNFNFQRLEAIGIRFLCNERVSLKKGGVTLAGVNDPSSKSKRFHPERAMRQPDVFQTVASAPTDRAVILMSHRPKLIQEAAAGGVDLQLSGHTHGGLFPGIRRLVGWLLNRGYTSGYYTCGKTQMIVTSGTGIWCGFPVRFGFPPEILLIRVRSRPVSF